jgi:hypothetical protein
MESSPGSLNRAIIALKSRDGLSDDLRFGVASTDGGLILLDHQEDGRRTLK